MTERTCSVSGCMSPYRARGFCSSHLNRFNCYGDPLHVQRPPRPEFCSYPGCANRTEARALCNLHYQRWRTHGDPSIVKKVMLPWPRNLLDRTAPQPSGCLYHGKGVGYSEVLRNGRPVKAHVAAYEMFVGPIPVGLVLDHLCHDPSSCTLNSLCPHRSCVNVNHLEPVTPAENILRGGGPPAINARKTHCIHGHEFTEENTYRRKDGGRECRACMRIRGQENRRASRRRPKIGGA